MVNERAKFLYRIGNSMSNSTLTRRQWLNTSALAPLTGPLLQAARGPYKGPLGAELYTVRGLMPKSDQPTLEAIAKIGYSEVEGDYPTFMRTAPLLKQYGLKPVSCHIPTPLVTGNWKPWAMMASMEGKLSIEKVFEDLAKLGTKYAVLAYLMPGERGGPDEMKKVAEQMNAAGAKAKAAGLQFAYHNHAFEFEGEPGHRTIDVFTQTMDPKLVGFEMDVFWVSVAGNDPVEWLKKLKGRVPLVHLKDKNKGFPTRYKEDVPADTFKEVGSGSIDFAKVIPAAQAAGVKHFFVEQDHTAGDPVASLAKSYSFVRELKLG